MISGFINLKLKSLVSVMEYFIMPFLLVVVSGLYFVFRPRRNGIFGYRTPRSFKSEQTWAYANRLASKFMLILGITGVFGAYLASYFNFNPVIVHLVTLGLIIVLIFVVEILLHRKFDEEGNPKS